MRHILTALLLTACAGQPMYFWQWEDRPSRPASKTIAYVRLTHSQMLGVCAQGTSERIPNGNTFACAAWHPDECVIFHASDLEPWQRAHEEKHCAGYSHE